MKKRTQDLIAEVPWGCSQVGITIGIDLGDEPGIRQHRRFRLFCLKRMKVVSALLRQRKPITEHWGRLRSELIT
jgi:hypothetical protein